MSASSTLLIVRHATGRGPGPNFGTPFLDYVRSHRPELSGRLRLWSTRSSPPTLEGVRAVLFWLADPLRELHPECFREAASIAEQARERGLRLINPPEALSNTIKSTQARCWSAAAVPSAACLPFRNWSEFLARLGEAEFPAIVRPDRLHSQEATHFCRTARRAVRLNARDLIYPGVILPFIDTRADYARSIPRSLWARFFHKKRSFVFGNRVLSTHILFSRYPVVGMDRSTFHRYHGRGRHLLPLLRFRRWDRAAVAADNAFWRGPPEQPDLMLRAARALDLDVVAFDYSTRADGSVVLWEANPYFSLDRWQEGVMPLDRCLEERITGFAAAYADFLEELLDGPASGSAR